MHAKKLKNEEDHMQEYESLYERFFVSSFLVSTDTKIILKSNKAKIFINQFFTMKQLNSKLGLTLLITLFVLGQMTTSSSCALEQNLPPSGSPFLVKVVLATNRNLVMVYDSSSHYVRVNWIRGGEFLEVIYNSNDDSVSFRSNFKGELLTYQNNPQTQSAVFFSAPSYPAATNQRFQLIIERNGLSIRSKQDITLALGVKISAPEQIIRLYKTGHKDDEIPPPPAQILWSFIR